MQEVKQADKEAHAGSQAGRKPRFSAASLSRLAWHTRMHHLLGRDGAVRLYCCVCMVWCCRERCERAQVGSTAIALKKEG